MWFFKSRIKLRCFLFPGLIPFGNCELMLCRGKMHFFLISSYSVWWTSICFSDSSLLKKTKHLVSSYGRSMLFLCLFNYEAVAFQRQDCGNGLSWPKRGLPCLQRILTNPTKSALLRFLGGLNKKAGWPGRASYLLKIPRRLFRRLAVGVESSCWCQHTIGNQQCSAVTKMDQGRLMIMWLC